MNTSQSKQAPKWETMLAHKGDRTYHCYITKPTARLAPAEWLHVAENADGSWSWCHRGPDRNPEWTPRSDVDVSPYLLRASGLAPTAAGAKKAALAAAGLR